jgi:hypothetical protein
MSGGIAITQKLEYEIHGDAHPSDCRFAFADCGVDLYAVENDIQATGIRKNFQENHEQ